MYIDLIHRLFAFIACVLVLAQPAWAAEGASRPLVSVQWLTQNLNREDVLLIDASPARLHAAGHIPGAVNVDIFTFGGFELPPAQMEKRFQSWGVSEGRKVVFYDQGGTYLATNLFYDLYLHGFPLENMGVLDGGLAKWKAEAARSPRTRRPRRRRATTA